MKMYQEPVTEIIEFGAVDIITASGIDDTNGGNKGNATDHNDWTIVDGKPYSPTYSGKK